MTKMNKKHLNQIKYLSSLFVYVNPKVTSCVNSQIAAQSTFTALSEW